MGKGKVAALNRFKVSGDFSGSYFSLYVMLEAKRTQVEQHQFGVLRGVEDGLTGPPSPSFSRPGAQGNRFVESAGVNRDSSPRMTKICWFGVWVNEEDKM